MDFDLRTFSPVLLSGIPGSGKSSFGRWLQAAKGFIYLDIENGALESAGLTPLWNSMFSPQRSVTGFVSALGRMANPVVLDWGFPPLHLPIVESLTQAGVEVWWFDGDRGAARDSFLRRGTVSVECLNIQMDAIAREWQ
jgi:hypothetical protein